jgi:hypothetical protein
MKTAQKFNYPDPPPRVSKSRPQESRAYSAGAYSAGAYSPRTHSPRSKPKSRNHAALAIETTIKIAINGGLSVVAIAALSNLFPYYWGQREKVQAIRMEVRETEYKVTRLRANLNRSFDPSQALTVMQEQSAMLAPNQRRIILMDEAESR